MIHVIASIQVKQGRMMKYIEIFKSNILKEKGCVEYMITIDTPSALPAQELKDHVVTIIEKWNSREDLKTHLSAPHMLSYRDKVKDLVDGMSLKVLKEV